jgi:hypothetical protein
MNHLTLSRLFVPATLAAAALAQGPDLLVTYSQPEVTTSGSGGTNLRFLAPNEIAHLEWSAGPCSSLSAEKWAPRTCFHTMAGDENGDGTYWNPAIFGSIDALVATMSTTPVGGVNPRTVFYSPSAAMGTNISGIPGLRPGDVGRIVRTSAGDGQVEYFMRQEQFNQSLGLPLNTPIDVDAIAFSPNYGVLFSLDQDIVANTICGPMLIQDGAVIQVSPWALTYTPDFRIASVLPVSAAVLYTEAQIDAFVNNAQVTDRFGICLTNGIDLESLEIDWGWSERDGVPVWWRGAQRALADLLVRDDDGRQPAHDGRRRHDLRRSLRRHGTRMRRRPDARHPDGYPAHECSRRRTELRQRPARHVHVALHDGTAAARAERVPCRRAVRGDEHRHRFAVALELRVHGDRAADGARLVPGLPVLAVLLPGPLHPEPQLLLAGRGARRLRFVPDAGDPGQLAGQGAVPELRLRRQRDRAEHARGHRRAVRRAAGDRRSGSPVVDAGQSTRRREHVEHDGRLDGFRTVRRVAGQVKDVAAAQHALAIREQRSARGPTRRS